MEKTSKFLEFEDGKLILKFAPPRMPPDGQFVTPEAWQRYSMLPQMLEARRKQAQTGDPAPEEAAPKRWLPDADLSFQPFVEPTARVPQSFPSSSSRGATPSAAPCHSPEGELSEPFSGGSEPVAADAPALVGSSSFAASHISNDPLNRPSSSQGNAPDPRGHPDKQQQHQAAPEASAEKPPVQVRAWSLDVARGAFAGSVSSPPRQQVSEKVEVKNGLLSALDTSRLAARKAASTHAFLHTAPKPREKAEMGNIDRQPGKRQISAPVAEKRSKAAKGTRKLQKIVSGLQRGKRKTPAVAAVSGAKRARAAVEDISAGTELEESGIREDGNDGDMAFDDEFSDLLAAHLEGGSPEEERPAGDDDTEISPLEVTHEAPRPAFGQTETRQAAKKPKLTTAKTAGPVAGQPAEAAANEALDELPSNPMKATNSALDSLSRMQQADFDSAQIRQEAGDKLPEDQTDVPAISQAQPQRGPLQEEPQSLESSPVLLPKQSPGNAAQQVDRPSAAAAKDRTHSLPRSSLPKTFKLFDLVTASSPAFDPGFEAGFNSLHKHARAVTHEGTTLLSGLTRQQHTWFVKNAGQSLKGQSLAGMNELQMDVKKEQALYMHGVNRIGRFQFRETLQLCLPAALRHFEADTAKKMKRVRALPRWYYLSSNKRLDSSKESAKREPAQIRHLEAVDVDCQPTTFFPPPEQHQFTLLTAQLSEGPAGGSAPPAALNKAEEKEMSQDEHVMDRMDAGIANAAASSSALLAISGLSVRDYGPAWEVPFLVRQSGSEGPNQVILEKPLLLRKSTAREKHTRLFKWALVQSGMSCAKQANEDAGDTKSISRPARLDLLEVGKVKLLVRSHPFGALGSSDSVNRGSSEAAADDPASHRSSAEETGGVPVVVRAKMEYHAAEDTQGELITDAELAKWWLTSQIVTGASIWVGRVHSRLHRLMRGELLTHESLATQAAAKRIPQRFIPWLTQLLERMLQLKPGQYLMTHAPNAAQLSFFQSTNSAPVGFIKPLPLNANTTADAASSCFDLWAAHARSGALNTKVVDYVPLSWKPPDPNLLQIPYTFRPQPSVPKRRQRKLAPSIFTRGHGQDWDEPAEALPPAPKADASQLYDDL